MTSYTIQTVGKDISVILSHGLCLVVNTSKYEVDKVIKPQRPIQRLKHEVPVFASRSGSHHEHAHMCPLAPLTFLLTHINY